MTGHSYCKHSHTIRARSTDTTLSLKPSPRARGRCGPTAVQLGLVRGCSSANAPVLRLVTARPPWVTGPYHKLKHALETLTKK